MITLNIALGINKSPLSMILSCFPQKMKKINNDVLLVSFFFYLKMKLARKNCSWSVFGSTQCGGTNTLKTYRRAISIDSKILAPCSVQRTKARPQIPTWRVADIYLILLWTWFPLFLFLHEIAVLPLTGNRILFVYHLWYCLRRKYENLGINILITIFCWSFDCKIIMF